MPIFDAEGRLAQMYGRRVREGDLRPGTAKHLYLPHPHTAVWNEGALRSSQDPVRIADRRLTVREGALRLQVKLPPLPMP